MSEYKLPDVGEGLTEAEVVTWKVNAGAPHQHDQVMHLVDAVTSEIEQDADQGEPAVPATGVPVEESSGAARALAKPPVRKLARDLGVDLATVTPSGPGGSVTRADV